jgi:hypothetical protein
MLSIKASFMALAFMVEEVGEASFNIRAFVCRKEQEV